MTPAEYNFTCVQGDKFAPDRITIYTDESGSLEIPSRVVFELRDKTTGALVASINSDSGGGIVFDTDSGQNEIYLDLEIEASVMQAITDGIYKYGLKLDDLTYLKGDFEIIRHIVMDGTSTV